jgi:preprotein translocase subunit SecE
LWVRFPPLLPKKKRKQNGMVNGKTRVSLTDFIRQVRQETTKVTWPTRKETMVTVIMVFVFSLILALYFLFIDGVIEFGISKILH